MWRAARRQWRAVPTRRAYASSCVLPRRAAARLAAGPEPAGQRHAAENGADGDAPRREDGRDHADAGGDGGEERPHAGAVETLPMIRRGIDAIGDENLAHVRAEAGDDGPLARRPER